MRLCLCFPLWEAIRRTLTCAGTPQTLFFLFFLFFFLIKLKAWILCTCAPLFIFSPLSSPQKYCCCSTPFGENLSLLLPFSFLWYFSYPWGSDAQCSKQRLYHILTKDRWIDKGAGSQHTWKLWKLVDEMQMGKAISRPPHHYYLLKILLRGEGFGLPTPSLFLVLETCLTCPLVPSLALLKWSWLWKQKEGNMSFAWNQCSNSKNLSFWAPRVM